MPVFVLAWSLAWWPKLFGAWGTLIIRMYGTRLLLLPSVGTSTGNPNN